MTKERAVKIWLHDITQGKVSAVRKIADLGNLGRDQTGKMQTAWHCNFYTFFLHTLTL